MAVTAKLGIKLYANEVVVAESDDATLWHKVLAAINSGSAVTVDPDVVVGRPELGAGAPVERWAREVGVTTAELEGACGPQLDSPYLQLAPKNWETFKKKTPERGPGSVGPGAISATLLAMWFRHAGISGGPTQAQSQAVLQGLSTRDANFARSVRNCGWLVPRSSVIAINPAHVSKAIQMAAAFIQGRAVVAADAQ